MMARRDVYNRRMRDQRRMLTAVARGAVPADRYVRGGTLLNVYTGELYPANVDFNILVLGRDPAAMAQAVNRVLDVHGGLVLVDGDRVAFELALPLGGLMTHGSLLDIAAQEDALRAALVARGYPHHEPLFSLFFLAADFLPAVRLTPRGVWDVKRGRVLLPSRRRTAARRASRGPGSP
jgi:adenine deaminase